MSLKKKKKTFTEAAGNPKKQRKSTIEQEASHSKWRPQVHFIVSQWGSRPLRPSAIRALLQTPPRTQRSERATPLAFRQDARRKGKKLRYRP
jgi:ribosomal protein S11